MQRQINSLPKIDKVLLSKILNAFFRFWLIPLLLVRIRFLQAGNILLAQDLLLSTVPKLFVGQVVWVKFEQVKFLLSLHVLVKIKLVSYLVLQLHQVKLRNNSWLFLEACLPDCEQILDAVLGLLTYLRFMKKTFEAIKNGSGSSRGDF